MIYAMIGMAIAMALAFGYAKIEHSGKVAAQAETEACNTARVAMGEQIKQQNAAVDALTADAAKKQVTASQALAKAEGRAKVWDADAARLRAVLAGRKKGDATDCKAAWQELRK